MVERLHQRRLELVEREYGLRLVQQEVHVEVRPVPATSVSVGLTHRHVIRPEVESPEVEETPVPLVTPWCEE